MTPEERLQQEIYTQLLEFYIADLEVELFAEKLKNANTGIPVIPVPYPWHQQPRTWPSPNTGDWYGPPWYVTCQAE